MKTLKKIHINMHVIRKNKKENLYDPVVTVKSSSGNFYGHRVQIEGPSEIVYPEKPLSCGARVWVETRSPVQVIDEVTNTVSAID